MVQNAEYVAAQRAADFFFIYIYFQSFYQEDLKLENRVFSTAHHLAMRLCHPQCVPK